MIIETPRLRLRPWTDADVEPWIAMATDAELMRYVSPTPIARADAEAAARHYRRRLESDGYGWWILEIKGGAPFAGIVLLQDVTFQAAFTPAVEVGWLLTRAQWGNGYATEGARAALDYGFATLKQREIVALTLADNLASQRVMQRLGMTHDPADDFDHPHAHLACVLYRMRHPQANDGAAIR